MKLVSLIAAVTLAIAAGSASAKVEVGGSATQDFKVKNGGIVNFGFGNATQKLNNVEGNVKVGGSLSQKLSIENGGLVNFGFGDATQKVNNIEGK